MNPVSASNSPTRGMLNSPMTRHPLKSAVQIDSCKILEPTRKTIQTLEAQRIMAVIEDTIQRLELVRSLQQVLQRIGRFKVMLGTDLVDLLDNHGNRQDHYQKLAGRLQKEDLRIACTERQTLINKSLHGDAPSEVFAPSERNSEDNSEEPESEDANEYWQMLKKDIAIGQQGLKYSLLDILRYFKKNPRAMENILALKLPGAPAYRTFLEYMEKLMAIMKERLLTFPSEELRRKKMITDIFVRERKTNKMLEKLQGKYLDAVKDKEEEIAQRNAVISRLKHELSTLEKFTRDQQQKTVSDSLKQCSFDVKNSRTRKTRAKDEMLAIKKELRDHRRENREAETSMRKRTFKIGTEVYNWVQKYDADMGSKQDEYDQINAQYELEKEDLAELESRFKVVEEQYEVILEERKIAEEAQRQREEELRIMNMAASKIQAAWKSYGLRKNANKKGQKKGGKNAGKKKGKK